ncbi:MAG TPA: DMT family transporter [Buchnera sp. (in: enterobacteria)]|nr:DMT family transporter [Buchnera sp. (in: enterobacteria)]
MHRIMIIILFIIVTGTWGTTWLAMKIALSSIPPLCATGMRFLLASPLLISLAYYTKSPLLFPSGNRLFQLIITIFYFSLPFSLMLYGGLYVNSYISSIIFANMPIIVIIISLFLLKKKLYISQFIGLMITLLFLLIILIYSTCVIHDCQWKGVFAIIISMISHAIMYIQCKKNFYNISVLTFNALPSLLSGIILLIIAYFFENPIIYNFSIKSILATFYLGNVSGVFGILSYFYLQKKVSVYYASTVFLVFPFIATSLDYYIFEYNISIYQLLLTIPFIFGLLLTLYPKSKN